MVASGCPLAGAGTDCTGCFMQGSPMAALTVSFMARPPSCDFLGLPRRLACLEAVVSLGGSRWGQGSFPAAGSLRGDPRTVDVARHFLPSHAFARPVRQGKWWANLCTLGKPSQRQVPAWARFRGVVCVCVGGGWSVRTSAFGSELGPGMMCISHFRRGWLSRLKKRELWLTDTQRISPSPVWSPRAKLHRQR